MSEVKKPRNRMYQVFELKASIEEAIENLKNYMVQQGMLVESVVNYKYNKELKDFVQDVVKDSEIHKSKLAHLEERLAKCNHILELYKKQDETSEIVSDIVTSLIEALNLGVDEKPAKA